MNPLRGKKRFVGLQPSPDAGAREWRPSASLPELPLVSRGLTSLVADQKYDPSASCSQGFPELLSGITRKPTSQRYRPDKDFETDCRTGCLEKRCRDQASAASAFSDPSRKLSSQQLFLREISWRPFWVNAYEQLRICQQAAWQRQ